MKYKIETFTQAQSEARAGRINEDTYVVDENEEVLIAAIFDGASSIASVTGVGMVLSGRLAAQNGATGIHENFAKAESAWELAISANRHIARELRKQGIDIGTASALDVSQASGTIARIEKHPAILEIAQVGESIGLLVYTDGRVEPALAEDPEPYDTEAVALAQEHAKQKGISLREAFIHPEIAPQIEKLMSKSRLCDNSPEAPGCGVFNGSRYLEKYIRIRDWNLSEIRQVLLLSDGMWLPTTRFNAEPDWKAMADIINEGGLEGLYKQVLEMKNSDPDLVHFPRWKKHDDATGIRIQLFP